jgi:hypothetical protein
LKACETVLRTGNADVMGKLVKAALSGEVGDETAPIDVDAAGADDAVLRWQADGGDAGWMDFDDASNAVAEAARKSGSTEASFANQWGSYTLNLDFMVQTNVATGTARPVRYVS